MLNNYPTNARERVAQLEHAQQIALHVLSTYESLCDVCPGYNLDICGGDHERARRQSAEASQRLAEARGKIALRSSYPAFILRLFRVWQSL
jgi:hypothetical protein